MGKPVILSACRTPGGKFGGNLTFAVDGFDILHNLSKVTRTVNAQGRIESYSNVLPSYFMAHVIYKLNIQPKKK